MLRLGERDELNVVSDQIGSPTYATDLAGVILEIIDNKDKECSTEIYHYSNEGEISWYDFAREIFKLTRINCKVNPITTDQYPTLAKRPRNTFMDKEKIVKIYNTGITKWKTSLDLSMKIMING